MRNFLVIGVSSALVLQVTAVWAAPAASHETRAAGAQAASVTIEGKTQIARGQAPPEYVQLRSLETGQLVATTTCNSQGDFSFDHRRPGRYSVELVSPGGAIVGSSAAIAAPARAAVAPVMVAATMSPLRKPATAAAGATVGGTASLVTTTAAAAGISGVAVAGRHHPSPSF